MTIACYGDSFGYGQPRMTNRYKYRLFSQAELDAAVAAERERWESALGAVMPADFKDWHQNSAMERPAVAAWVIRNLRDREAHLEGVLAGVQDGA